MTTTRLAGVRVAMSLAMVVCVSVADGAEASLVVRLWPGGVPGKATDLEEKVLPSSDGIERITNVGKPSLELFKAATTEGLAPAVVVCPGGGYSILACDLEGTEIARWLNSIGITAAVLKYRVPDNRAGALQDVQRAVRLVRGHAGDWNIDPKRVGVLGFSAGGHLAARASTGFATSSYAAVDATDRLDCRPDFTVLIYPAYLSQEDGHIASDITVTRQTPPAFLVQTQDDRKYVGSSIAYYLALKKAGVPAELHLFPNGGHGYGLRPPSRVATTWPRLCEAWLRESGVLPGNGSTTKK